MNRLGTIFDLEISIYSQESMQQFSDDLQENGFKLDFSYPVISDHRYNIERMEDQKTVGHLATDLKYMVFGKSTVIISKDKHLDEFLENYPLN